MAYKASFKTGLDQRELVGNFTVNTAGKVGYLYSISGTDMTLLTTAPVAGTKYAMIAQADDTLGYGHVPVEYRDYKYSDEIAASTTAKMVAYYLVDTSDINYTTVS